MAYLWQAFSYDRWYNARMFTRTADQLFQEKVLGGCSDFALVEMTFFRALSIPARLVVTANAEWIQQIRNHPYAMIEGHAFIEVFLEDRWFLVDPTFKVLFSGYDPDAACYPRKEVFCCRGRDFWDLGIRRVEDLQRILEKTAEDNQDARCGETAYGQEPL